MSTIEQTLAKFTTAYKTAVSSLAHVQWSLTSPQDVETNIRQIHKEQRAAWQLTVQANARHADTKWNAHLQRIRGNVPMIARILGSRESWLLLQAKAGESPDKKIWHFEDPLIFIFNLQWSSLVNDGAQASRQEPHLWNTVQTQSKQIMHVCL